MQANAIPQQQWYDQAQALVDELVKDDADDVRGVLMLDGSSDHWDWAYEEGLTPQQAFDKLVVGLALENTPGVGDELKAEHDKLSAEAFEHARREVACLTDAQWAELKQEEIARRKQGEH